MFSLNGNWVDLVIILVLIYYASVAWRDGFLFIMAGFGAFFLSLVASLRVYKFAAVFLKANFNLSQSLANALGFIGASILLEMLFDLIFKEILSKLPPKVLKSKFNKLLGLLPALGEGLILIAFLLTATIALPVRPDIKKAVSESKFGGLILKETSGIEKDINQVFGGAINDALTYLTVEPKSNESLKLPTAENHLSVDSASEVKMLIDLNHERTSRGLEPLTLNPKYRDIARDYARDMWTRKYFSHYNPEGRTVADRFDAAGINYGVAGENLALAPTEETAHTGLMNSEGHRKNILDPDYRKIGIGVIDNGIYGKIFVQEFSD